MTEIFASLENIILITLSFGVLGFLVGRLHKGLGSVVTILGSLFVFGSIGYYGIYLEQLDITADLVPYVTYSVSYLGIFFAVLVSFVFLMVSFFNPFFIEKYKYPAVYNMLFLFSLAGTVGVFFTNNLLYLFFFFELVVWTSLFLIPMGKSKKAASVYYGFSAAGSFALLFAVLMIFSLTGSFNIAGITDPVVTGGYKLTIFFLLMVAAFAKLGAFPLHIWLPKVLKNAPDPVSAVFSGGLEKLGAFVAVLGLVKLSQITPVSGMLSLNGNINMPYTHYFIAILGALTIVFGTLMAIRQDDAKKLLAYSSMSNGGYILVAFSMMNSQAVAGGFYHVIAHALASTAAFLAIAAVSRVAGTTKMKDLGGMIHKMPITYMVYLIAIISMAGIPPMGGFISKWLIFQSLINNGMIFVGIAAFFGSIGSFLYVFRPLAALFLGQELPRYKGKVKEAPFFMLLPMLILSLLNVFTGVLPIEILKFINKIMMEIGEDPLEFKGLAIKGMNATDTVAASYLQPTLIAGMFGIGVAIAFVIFIVLKKSKKVGLMDTYTAGNFIYTEDLLHYSLDFYAPLERLYAKYTKIMKNFYKSLANKVVEVGQFFKYFFFTNKPEVMVIWIMIVVAFLLWGDVL